MSSVINKGEWQGWGVTTGNNLMTAEKNFTKAAK